MTYYCKLTYNINTLSKIKEDKQIINSTRYITVEHTLTYSIHSCALLLLFAQNKNTLFFCNKHIDRAFPRLTQTNIDEHRE